MKKIKEILILAANSMVACPFHELAARAFFVLLGKVLQQNQFALHPNFTQRLAKSGVIPKTWAVKFV